MLFVCLVEGKRGEACFVNPTYKVYVRPDDQIILAVSSTTKPSSRQGYALDQPKDIQKNDPFKTGAEDIDLNSMKIALLLF